MAVTTGLFRLGRDAELRTTQSGKSICMLSLVYNYGLKQAGVKQSQWVRASLWGKRGESLAPYLLRGSQISAVLDDVHIETFTKKDGSASVALAARVLDVELVSSGGSSDPKASHVVKSKGAVNVNALIPSSDASLDW